jgi:hypothetical protein
MLSDIGVYQTDNAEDARIAEHQSLRDLQASVNEDYEARHNWILEEALSGNFPLFGVASEEVTVTAEIGELAAEPQNPESVDLVTIEHFNDTHTRDIRAAVNRLFSDPCTAAFRKYGLTPPIESQLAGIIIRPATDLINLSPDQLGISEQTRNAYREQFFGNTANSNAQGGTVPGSRNGKNITSDGRAQVYLAGSAWAGESYLFNTFSFQDVVSHEFIHVGGRPPTPGRLGSWRHDLAGFAGFDEILKACR